MISSFTEPTYKAVRATDADGDAGDLSSDSDVYSRQCACNSNRRKCQNFGVWLAAVFGIIAIFTLGFVFGYSRMQADADAASSHATSTHPQPSTACIKPYYRREWRMLSREEKKAYLDAFTCMTTTPSTLHGGGTAYDDFAWTHNHIAHDTHFAAPFLSWHRHFIAVFESHLRTRCNYTGTLPYWDWTLDWESLASSPVFAHKLGFGGDGDPKAPVTVGSGRCVTDGPFAGLKPLFSASLRQPHCLSRGFAENWYGDYLGPAQIETVLAEDGYKGFYVALEKVHDVIPLAIRGDFVNFTAPNEPLFYLHHAQLDRLWALWQQRDPASRLKSYGGIGSNGRTVQLNDVLAVGSLGKNVTVADIMDTEGGELCYRYM